MPDGDKFCWGVRGTGSRTFLNLARSASTPLSIVADQAAKVATVQLKRPTMQQAIRGSLRLLELGLPCLEGDSSCALPRPAVVRDKFRQMRQEVAGDDFAAVAVRTFEGKHEQLLASGRAFSFADLRQELGESCAHGILGHAVLDAKRIPLMAETGRSALEQHAFERRVDVETADRISSVINRICESTHTEPIRSPRRRSPREDFTLERLHAPLAL